MPCRTAGEFIALDQYDATAAFLRQVVEGGTACDATTRGDYLVRDFMSNSCVGFATDGQAGPPVNWQA